MDEEFENLSFSSSDEWAILDENSENNNGITDKFCSICGVELDQLEYKRDCCPLCPVCYICYQNYPPTTFSLNCEHTKEKLYCMHDLQQTPLSSAGSSLSENDLLICQPPAETNGSVQTNVHDGNVMAKNGNEHTKLIDKEEEDFPLQSAALPVSSSPRLIPFLSQFDAPPSGAATAFSRCSLSWSDCGGPVSSSSTDSDRQEEEHVVPWTATSLEHAAAAGGSGSMPADELTARLAGFELASPAPPSPPYGYVRCAPKPMATISCAGRPAVGVGSPPTATSFFAIRGLGVRSRSPLPSPPLPSNHSSTRSGSPMNSAAQFLKSVVKHSAMALNNFDFLPMDPCDGILPETGSSSSVKLGALSSGSGLPTELRLQERPTQPTAQMTADPLMLSVKKHTLADGKLRALVTPKTIPKCVFKASDYNLR